MSLPMTYWHPSSRRILLIDASAVEAMVAFRQNSSRDREAGGVLIGESRGEHVWVREATPPQPDDIRTRATFLRCSGRHQQLVDEAWARSEGTLSYVGEWHTHPEDHPTPSVIDRASLFLRSLQAAHTLVAVIVGLRSNYVAIQDKFTLGVCELQAEN
jgi:integrative and conjugative element protein (TIGR02256 family)